MEIIGWIFLLILGLLFGLMTYIIFVPVYLKVNTQNKLYLISQLGTFQLSYTPVQKPHFSMKIFGITVPDSNKPYRKKMKKKKSRLVIKRSIQSWLFLIRGLIKSFRVKRLIGTADLDDVFLNSQFFAIYPFINQGPVQLTTNFNNVYYLDFILEGKLNKMLYTFIIFLTKK